MRIIPSLAPRTALAALALTSTSLFAQVARADAPSSLQHGVEFQLDAQALTTVIKDKAIQQQFCFDDFACPVGGGTCTVDHVEFPSPAALRHGPTTKSLKVSKAISVSATPLQITLPVQAHVKTIACVNDAACPPDKYLMSPTVTAVFELSVSGTNICAGFDSIEPALPELDPVVAKLKAAFGTQCVPVDLKPLQPLLGSHAVSGGGVSANAALDRLAVRFEFDNTSNSSQSQWASFLQSGNIGPVTPGKGWSLLVGQSLLREALMDRLVQGITESSSKLSIDPGDPQTTTWTASPPTVTVSLGAEADTGVCPNTIGVNPITSTIPFTLSPQGEVVTNGTVDWDVVDSDVFLCGLALGGFVFAPITVPIAAAIASGYDPSYGVPQCDTPDSHHFECAYPVALPPLQLGSSGPQGKLTVDDLHGIDAGLVLAGPVALPPVPPTQSAKIDFDPVELGVHGDCNSLRVSYEGGMSITGIGKLCKPIAAKNDPLHVYQYTEEDPSDVALSKGYGIRLWDTPSFWADPYPPVFTVRTSGGSFTFEGKEPVEYTGSMLPYEIEKINAQVSCMKLEDGWLGIPGKFDPHWHVDPPADWVVQITPESSTTGAIKAIGAIRGIDVQLPTLGVVRGSFAKEFAISRQPVLVTAEVIVAGAKGEDPTAVTMTAKGYAEISGASLGKAGVVQMRLARPLSLALSGTSKNVAGGAKLTGTATIGAGAVDLFGVPPAK